MYFVTRLLCGCVCTLVRVSPLVILMMNQSNPNQQNQMLSFLFNTAAAPYTATMYISTTYLAFLPALAVTEYGVRCVRAMNSYIVKGILT